MKNLKHIIKENTHKILKEYMDDDAWYDGYNQMAQDDAMYDQYMADLGAEEEAAYESMQAPDEESYDEMEMNANNELADNNLARPHKVNLDGTLNENKNMKKKQIVRLTESDLHRVIKESVKRILSEGYDFWGNWSEDDDDTLRNKEAERQWNNVKNNGGRIGCGDTRYGTGTNTRDDMCSRW